MRRVIKASGEMFNDDVYLPLEHQLDLASQEAWALYRSQRRSSPFVSEQAHSMAQDIDAMKSKLRNLRSFMNKDYSQTADQMIEDNSRYLED